MSLPAVSVYPNGESVDTEAHDGPHERDVGMNSKLPIEGRDGSRVFTVIDLSLDTGNASLCCFTSQIDTL